MNRDPELGDLIEIYRGVYNHWAIYVGGGYVVHFLANGGGGGASSSSSSSSGANFCKLVGLGICGIVKKEKLEKVVKNDPWVINNSLDDERKPRIPQEIVDEANKLVGKNLPYNFITNNCEHFVKKLRYGTAVSEQVDEVAKGGVIGAVSGFTKRHTMRLVLHTLRF